MRLLFVTLVLSTVALPTLAQDECSTAQELEDMLIKETNSVESVVAYCGQSFTDYCVEQHAKMEIQYQNRLDKTAVYQVTDTECGTSIVKATQGHSDALRAALGIEAPQIDIAREVIAHIVDPCYTQVAEVAPLSDSMTIEEAVADMKQANTSMVDNLIAGIQTVVHPDMSFDERNAHYEYAQRFCTERLLTALEQRNN